MTDRPRKLSPICTLVVWGARGLTLGEKVVWYHDWALDQGGADGSYISHKSMAERVGESLTAATVERARQRLKRLGLHQPLRRVDARNVGWVSTLPATCIATKPGDAPRLAVLLDQHIKQHDAWVAGETVPAPDPLAVRPWTYFIRTPDAVKIGEAWDVDRRLEQLQTAQMVKLRLVGKTRAIPERVAHREWAHLLIRGEWYEATPHILDWIKVVCAEGFTGDPPQVDRGDYHEAVKQGPPATALGGKGGSSLLASNVEHKLPSSFTEKGVGSDEPETTEGRALAAERSTPDMDDGLTEEERWEALRARRRAQVDALRREKRA